MPLAVEEQLTIHQLLEDSVYKKWLKKIPSIGSAICPSGKPWRVWVQMKRGGRWSRKDFEKYQEAYVFLRGQLHYCHDAALNCKVREFRPPVVRDPALGLVKFAGEMVGKKRYHIPSRVGQHEMHEWCPHCRRPTIFTWFSKHHSFPKPVTSSDRRCNICGIRLIAVRHYR